MSTNIRDRVHADTTRMPFNEVVRILNESVGVTVVQAVTGVKDRSTPYSWAREDGPTPPVQTMERVKLAYRVWSTIERTDGKSVALAWMVGSNPRLDDDVPLDYIYELRAKEVLGAAESFVQDSHSA